MFKIPTYKEIADKLSEKMDNAIAEVRGKQLIASINLRNSKVQEESLRLESKVYDILKESPVNLDKLVEALDELALKDREQKQLDTIRQMLFPDNV